MNDVFGREQIASGDLGFAHIIVSKETAGFHQFHALSGGAVQPATT